MDTDWSVTSLDGHEDVTLVTVTLRNPEPVGRRVRVTNRLQGPVLAPRQAGVPEPGWDDEGFDGVVPAGGRRSLGYACPAPVERPPVAVDDEGRAGGDGGDRTAAAAVHGLGDPRPPDDAIPEAVSDDGHDGTSTDRGSDPLPPAVESWLSAVEERVAQGERLTGASVDTAAKTLAADEAVAVPELEDQLAGDAEALEAVAARAAALADRAAAVDVPVAALRRLA